MITSKPAHGSQISGPGGVSRDYQTFFDDVERLLNAPQLPVYTVASLPGQLEGAMIYVSDEVGGGVPAFSDGVDWRRVTDRAVVSD